MVDETVAVFDRTVPAAVPASTLTTSVKTALLPTPNDALEHETVPPVVHDHTGPLSCVRETNVVPAGNVSDSDALLAASGPLLVTVIV